MRFSVPGVAAVACAIFLSAGCSRLRTSFPKAPVVLISVDTLRADHLPAYGYRAVETPRLDALRQDSILFENAYCHAPLTLPSHATLLTGLLPYQHGVRDNIGFRLSPAHPTLASVLRGRGYATGAAVSSFVLRSDRGLAAGFDFYEDHVDPTSSRERSGDRTAERLEKWMEAISDKPVFLFLHLFEPHTPYAPSEPFRSRYSANPYDGEIAAADQIVGRFLEFLKRKKLYDPAILLFSSDHGEGLNDHGEEEHGVFLYRESIRVPLFLKLPGSRDAGRTVSIPVGLIDIVPTVTALLGFPAPKGVQGTSLLQFGQKGSEPERRVYSETLYPRLQFGWSDLASLTDARYQYIHAPRPELYDLLADPNERNDLAKSKPLAFRSMRIELESLTRPFALPEGSTREELEKLASLGYIGIAQSVAADEELPDPKDHVGTLKKYKRLFELFYAKKDPEAIAAAREILSENPRILSAWRMMSESLARTGRLEEAEKVLAEGIEQAGRSRGGEEISQAYDQLALRLKQAGDRRGFERVLREALGRNLATEPMKRDLAEILLQSRRPSEALAMLSPLSESPDTETLDLLGVALAEAGRREEARRTFLRALAIDPGNARVPFHLGTLSLREKDALGARNWFEKALRLDPRAPGILASLGLAQAQLGDERGALDSWREALVLDPKQYDALFNLAILAGRMGKNAEARGALERFLAAAPRDRYAEQRTEARRLLQALRSRNS